MTTTAAEAFHSHPAISAMTLLSDAPPPFDRSKAYKEWEVDGKYFGDGRELALLEYIYSHPSLPTLRHNPVNLLRAIDDFARSKTGLINIGEAKGKIVTDLIAEHKPPVMLELGGYIGYSAIMFGMALKEAGGTQYYSVEKDPLFAAVASSLIDLAGLRDTVRVCVGSGKEGIQRLADDGVLGPESKSLGMLFLDHHKPSYTEDLKLCEELGLVRLGTVLVADNMIIPGNPEYLDYVRKGTEQKRDGLASVPAGGRRGNPELIYRSHSVRSHEPSGMEDGLEITTCTAVCGTDPSP